MDQGREEPRIWGEGIARWLRRGVGVWAAVLTIAIIIDVTTDVVARWVFNSPISWAHELSVYLFIYAATIAMSYTLLYDRHIRVTLVWRMFSQRGQAALDLFASVAGLVFVTVGGWYGVEMTLDYYRRGIIRFETEWLLPVWVTGIIVPVSLFLMSIIFIFRLARSVKLLKGPDASTEKAPPAAE